MRVHASDLERSAPMARPYAREEASRQCEGSGPERDTCHLRTGAAPTGGGPADPAPRHLDVGARHPAPRMSLSCMEKSARCASRDDRQIWALYGRIVMDVRPPRTDSPHTIRRKVKE